MATNQAQVQAFAALPPLCAVGLPRRWQTGRQPPFPSSSERYSAFPRFERFFHRAADVQPSSAKREVVAAPAAQAASASRLIYPARLVHQKALAGEGLLGRWGLSAGQLAAPACCCRSCVRLSAWLRLLPTPPIPPQSTQSLKTTATQQHKPAGGRGRADGNGRWVGKPF
jgi:hypothetical protein